nr:hypothetical protein [Bacilli bacterium]
MKSIYAIPTHRPIDENNLRDYFSEVDYAIQIMKKDCMLIFFEDTEEHVNEANILRISSMFPKVKYMYINRNDTRKIYDFIYMSLSSKAQTVFKEIYPNANVNYGNIFNRIFIFAILLGADIIVRRDSDVLIEEKDGIKLYPIINELNLLGTKDNLKTIYICGGGYKGTYDLDIDSLIRDNGKDYSLVRKLFVCMSIPEEHHDDIINEEILNNNIPFEKDIIDYDSKSYPECGNIGLYKLFHYFPSPCQDFILGSDYFFIDVAVHSNLDVVYHNRAVIHKHTRDRKSEFSKVYNYWRGLLMLIDSQIFYRGFYEKYLDNNDYNDFAVIDNNVLRMTNDMKRELALFKTKNSERIVKLNNFIEVLQESNDADVRKISSMLEKEYDNIIKYTNQSIELHIKLIKYWNEICKATIYTASRDDVKEYLENRIFGGDIDE